MLPFFLPDFVSRYVARCDTPLRRTRFWGRRYNSSLPRLISYFLFFYFFASLTDSSMYRWQRSIEPSSDRGLSSDVTRESLAASSRYRRRHDPAPSSSSSATTTNVESFTPRLRRRRSNSGSSNSSSLFQSAAAAPSPSTTSHNSEDADGDDYNDDNNLFSVFHTSEGMGGGGGRGSRDNRNVSSPISSSYSSSSSLVVSAAGFVERGGGRGGTTNRGWFGRRRKGRGESSPAEERGVRDWGDVTRDGREFEFDDRRGGIGRGDSGSRETSFEGGISSAYDPGGGRSGVRGVGAGGGSEDDGGGGGGRLLAVRRSGAVDLGRMTRLR